LHPDGNAVRTNNWLEGYHRIPIHYSSNDEGENIN
jgi:hypothetical protein